MRPATAAGVAGCDSSSNVICFSRLKANAHIFTNDYYNSTPEPNSTNTDANTNADVKHVQKQQPRAERGFTTAGVRHRRSNNNASDCDKGTWVVLPPGKQGERILWGISNSRSNVSNQNTSTRESSTTMNRTHSRDNLNKSASTAKNSEDVSGSDTNSLAHVPGALLSDLARTTTGKCTCNGECKCSTSSQEALRPIQVDKLLRTVTSTLVNGGLTAPSTDINTDIDTTLMALKERLALAFPNATTTQLLQQTRQQLQIKAEREHSVSAVALPVAAATSMSINAPVIEPVTQSVADAVPSTAVVTETTANMDASASVVNSASTADRRLSFEVKPLDLAGIQQDGTRTRVNDFAATANTSVSTNQSQNKSLIQSQQHTQQPLSLLVHRRGAAAFVRARQGEREGGGRGDDDDGDEDDDGNVGDDSGDERDDIHNNSNVTLMTTAATKAKETSPLKRPLAGRVEIDLAKLLPAEGDEDGAFSAVRAMPLLQELRNQLRNGREGQ